MSFLLDEKREKCKDFVLFLCFGMDDDYDNDDNAARCEWIGGKRSKEHNKRCVKYIFSQSYAQKYQS
jgi:hypothetical protein